MSLNCGCPAGAHIADLDNVACKEGLGQIQKLLFQRRYKTAGTLNSVADPETKASWTTLLSAADGSKVTVSPEVYEPTTEVGASRTYGSGNQVLGGVPIVLGREATSFTGTFYEVAQSIIKQMKTYECEDIAVYLIDENGNIGALSTAGDGTAAEISPIPVRSFFVGDKNLGGFDEPDSNDINFSFLPNWSDNLVIVKRDTMDFNPLTDLINAASAEE